MTIDMLFRYYYRPLCMYAIHYLHDVDRAEDAVQDSFVRLVEAGQPLSGQTRGWLYTTVRNRCIDLLRQQDAAALPSDLDGPISDDEAQERSAREARLWTAIDSLPEKCRQIFLMAKRDGMRQGDIASELNISTRTVEHQVAKALRILRGKANELLRFLFMIS